MRIKLKIESEEEAECLKQLAAMLRAMVDRIKEKKEYREEEPHPREMGESL